MMRWIPFTIVVGLTMLIQTSAWRVLTMTFGFGSVAPDLAAVVAVFVAFSVRTSTDAMLAGWLLGLGLDLTTGGGPGAATVVGPMPIAFALASAMVYRLRDALYRERAVTQVIVTWIFCVLAHWMWGTMQTLRLGEAAWDQYKTMLLQILLVALYTAAIAPLVFFVLGKCQRLIITTASGRGR